MSPGRLFHMHVHAPCRRSIAFVIWTSIFSAPSLFEVATVNTYYVSVGSILPRTSLLASRRYCDSALRSLPSSALYSSESTLDPQSTVRLLNEKTNCRPPEISICEWKCVDPAGFYHKCQIVDTMIRTWLINTLGDTNYYRLLAPRFTQSCH